MPEVDRATVALRDDRGRTIATLEVVARHAGSLLELTTAEARELAEEPIQLLEGSPYEFVLHGAPDGMRLRESSIVQPSRADHCHGRIEPGLAVGIVPLLLESVAGHVTARSALEVRSTKLDYRSDYRTMLDDIARTMTALVTDLRAPAQIRLSPTPGTNAETLHHQFAFVRAMIASREFRDALARIQSQLHQRWLREESRVDIRRGARLGAAGVRSLARGHRRVPLPEQHPLHHALAASEVPQPSVPLTVSAHRSIATVNTPENRFVKHALAEFESFLSLIEQRLDRPAAHEVRLRREVMAERERLTQVLASFPFPDVSAATTLPLGSPVLQRRGGYRDILTAWLRFRLAANIAWDAGDDVFGAGRRDVALLYEYWLFFQLLDVASKVFDFDSPPTHQLVEWTHGRFDVRLKSGVALSFLGHSHDVPSMRVRFSYNRTFQGTPIGTSGYPRGGSWTRPMRPDYSISFWPADLLEEQAERNERIVHIHFDAKYRVDRLTDLFGSGSVDEAAEDEAADRANTRPKRADLLKMHAYRDAIRRTEGAYVLYPGTTPSMMWQGFHEIIPGLGAFSIRPGDDRSGLDAVEQFLRDLVAHLAQPGTRREKMRAAVRQAWRNAES